MLAYHNDPELKKHVVAQMAEHRKADELVKGVYWQNGKGCAVGCLIKSNDHMQYEEKFGIPVALARLEDIIFENLENGDSQKWPERFLNAIEPGADLSLVQWKFLHWLQKDNLKRAKKEKMPQHVINAIKACVDVLAPMAKGKPVDRGSAMLSAGSAWSAMLSTGSAWSAGSAMLSALSAMSSGRSAAKSAAESASASALSAEEGYWKKIADKLIGLIKEAA